MPDKNEADRLMNRVRTEMAIQEIEADHHRVLVVKDGNNEYAVRRGYHDGHDWVIFDRATGAEIARGDEDFMSPLKDKLRELLDRGARITAKDDADYGSGKKRDRDF